MGDRGGKKEKNKSQKQKDLKQEKKTITQQNKQKKNLPILGSGKKA